MNNIKTTWDKLGFHEKSEVLEDIPVPKYKSYEYTEKDFIDKNYYKKIPVIYIETDKTIKYSNGILEIDRKKIDVSLMDLKDFMLILEEEGIDVRLVEGESFLLTIPTTLLSSFTNITVQKYDGDVSPYPYLNYVKPNKTLVEIEREISNIHIIDLEDNKTKPFSIKNDYLFYTPNETTKIYITSFIKSFYISVGLEKKTIYNGKVIANLSIKNIEDY